MVNAHIPTPDEPQADSKMAQLATVEEMLREIRVFAESGTFGDNSKRFMDIQDFAFRRFAIMLNAKQLREMTRSGSQTTAQKAIEDFRSLLRQRLGYRLELGADVPTQLGAIATELIVQVWNTARTASEALLEEERRAVRQIEADAQRAVAVALEEAAISDLALRSVQKERDAIAARLRDFLKADEQQENWHKEMVLERMQLTNSLRQSELELSRSCNYEMLMKWIQAGANPSLTGLSGNVALVAAAILHLLGSAPQKNA